MRIIQEMKKVKTKTWLRIIWWIVLITVFSIYLYSRKSSILVGNAQTFDSIILIILLALLLIPLFQEIDLWGLKFKREVDELKREISSQIYNLKTVFESKVDLNNQSNQNFYINTSQIPPDSKLTELGSNYKNILQENTPQNVKADFIVHEPEINVPDQIRYLFVVRYNIDKEVSRILSEHNLIDNAKGLLSINRMLGILEQNEIFIRGESEMIREVYTICSIAIHGKELTEEKIDFVKNLAPELIIYLRSIKKRV